MLTETDIHYLVGVLSTVAQPEHVEVELGSMVLDATTGEARDVDVTVRVKDEESGGTNFFKGIEVKSHFRKLDATHVEQLAAKLNDMPSIARRAIVSASGYYRPAIKKAEAHKIELYELCDWDVNQGEFEHFKADLLPFTQTSLEWIAAPHVRLNPTQKCDDVVRAEVRGDLPVYFRSGQVNPEAPDLDHLLKNLRSQVQHVVFQKLKNQPQRVGEAKNVNVLVNISEKPHLKVSSGQFVLEQVRFTGAVTWVETEKETHYKALKKVGDDKPYAGCIVGELGSWGLVGIMVSRTKRDLRVIHVSVSDRNRRRIFKQRIA
ncbi:MAG: hypothetical protein HYY24_07110 [Verrucomicrobia bacterium]|nr:hypothetical protein [Verrucomicrobiota bacterium]